MQHRTHTVTWKGIIVNDCTLSMEHVGNISILLDECLEYREEKSNEDYKNS